LTNTYSFGVGGDLRGSWIIT